MRTPKGDIHTEWVVNAAGLWGREVAALAGISLPLQPTEHQYFVTETIAEIDAMDRRLPSVADRDGEYYLRQEGKGLLIGAYERDLKYWAEDGTPLDFAHDLFPDDLERIEDNMMRAIDRVPCVAEAGIKRVINGPMIWSPDSNVLFGPHPDLKNYFCCNGIIPGFSQSGGMGLMAAQWMIEGESSYSTCSPGTSRGSANGPMPHSPRPGWAINTPTGSRSISRTRNEARAARCACVRFTNCKGTWAQNSA